MAGLWPRFFSSLFLAAFDINGLNYIANLSGLGENGFAAVNFI